MAGNNPVDPDTVDPTTLDEELELVDHQGSFTCDGCSNLYPYDGTKIMKWDGGGLGGYRTISYLCKWCLHKLAISILERQLG